MRYLEDSQVCKEDCSFKPGHTSAALGGSRKGYIARLSPSTTYTSTGQNSLYLWDDMSMGVIAESEGFFVWIPVTHALPVDAFKTFKLLLNLSFSKKNVFQSTG